MIKNLVDVHTHLTHQKFDDDRFDMIERCVANGMRVMITNGLNPESNRQCLELQEKFPQVRAALGIYPLDAIFDLLPGTHPHPRPSFDRDAEIAFIEQQAQLGNIAAVGECGLDGHWADESTFKKQEEIFERLIDVAIRNDLPVIVHSRKRELRCFEILKHNNAKKVDFHCYGGKVRMALDAAENFGWSFSIPANSRRSDSFARLLKNLPIELILTETDAPYLAPTPGIRSEPWNVKQTVEHLAEVRGISTQEAADRIYANYQQLFEK